MPFVIPAMPLVAGIYDTSTGSPVLRSTSPCNLSMGARTLTGASGGTSAVGVIFTTPYLLLPALTDIRDVAQTGTTPDQAEVPYLSGRFYSVIYVDDLGKGFANEHRFAVLYQLPPWPVPLP